MDEGGRLFTGYSPFAAENVIKQSSDFSSVDEKRQDGSEKSDSA
jgi:hypothetical protein